MSRPPRLLMLSWRYLGHPAGGGAEVLTHETLQPLVRNGWRVTCFTAMYPGALERDEIDGVSVVRRGRQWTVHLHAWRWLRRRLDEFDLVIDQINTIPFCTPLYVPAEKRRFLIFQLAREYWWRETRGLFRLASPLGYLAEPQVLKLYRRTCGITISESTREDLAALGIPRERVDVIPTALASPPLAELKQKEGPFTVIMLGRLTPAKFVEEGIRSFAGLKRRVPDARLELVGSGNPRYRTRLERLISSERIGDVSFHGRVSERERGELLERAHVHLFTSHREGWGLVVSEAAAMGTPTVGYDAPGVRDSVPDRRLLAPTGDANGLRDRLLALHSDARLYEEVRLAAWQRTRGMTYDDAARLFAAALERPCPA